MRVSRLPDFIAIGLPRDTKETDFFSPHCAKGMQWSPGFFRDCAAPPPMGEISPNYFAAPEAPERIGLEGSPLLGKRVNRVTRGPRIALLAEQAWRLRRWLEARKAGGAAIAMLRKAGVWHFSFRGGGEFGPLDPALDRRLRERFRPEVEALETMLGRDFSRWKSPGGSGISEM
jgi:hypothetical protein